MYSVVKTVKLSYPQNSKNEAIKISVKNIDDHQIYIPEKINESEKIFDYTINKSLNLDRSFYDVDKPIKKITQFVRGSSIYRSPIKFKPIQNEDFKLYNMREIKDTRNISKENNGKGNGHQYEIKGPYAMVKDDEAITYKISMDEFQFEKIN